MANRTPAVVLSLLLVFPPSAWPVPQAVDSVKTNSAMDALNRATGLAGELRDTVNRKAFDLEAVIDHLDYDHEQIIAFVKEQIAYEQYRGLLKGPQGTLMGRSGNSLDQSVLLAKLLKDAGFDARIKRGVLEEKDAAKILGQMTIPRTAPAAIGNVGTAIGLLEDRGFITGLTQKQKEEVIVSLERSPRINLMPEYETFLSTIEKLKAKLGDRLKSGQHTGMSQLLTEAKDYYWVEYKAEVALPWVPVQPVFAGQTAIELPAVAETWANEVPAEMQHRIRLRMFIERRQGGRLETIPVSSAWERPVANLVNVPLVFASLPDSVLQPDAAGKSAHDLLKQAGYFLPILGDGVAEGASYFDINGNIIDPMVANAAPAGVFKTVGGAFGDAAAALGGESVLPMLTANWIEITMIVPGGEERVYRRMIFDRIGAALRESFTSDVELEEIKTDQLRPFLRTNTLIVAAGRTPRGMAVNEALLELQKASPGLEVFFKEPAGVKKEEPDKKKLGDVPGNWAGHLSLLSRFDIVESWSPKFRIYRHEPMVAIHTSGLGDTGGAMARVDIVTNSRRGIDISGDELRLAPEALIAAGVWETLVEGSMLVQGDTSLNTSRVFEQAASDGIPTLVVQKGDDISGLKMDADAKKHLMADIDRGYVVVVPQNKPGSLKQTGWWRIDPLTGQTLGLLDDGRGVEITEYMIVQFFGILGYLLLKYQLYQCFAGHNSGGGKAANLKLVCCIIFNYATFGAGAAVGVGVAAKMGEAVAGVMALTFDVWDMGTGLDDAVCNAIL